MLVYLLVVHVAKALVALVRVLSPRADGGDGDARVDDALDATFDEDGMDATGM